MPQAFNNHNPPNLAQCTHLGEGAVVVGLHLAMLGHPVDLKLVGDNARSDRAPVVATPAHQQQASLSRLWEKKSLQG